MKTDIYFWPKNPKANFLDSQNEHKFFYNNELCLSAEALAKAETKPKQTQSNPNKANLVRRSFSEGGFNRGLNIVKYLSNFSLYFTEIYIKLPLCH